MDTFQAIDHSDSRHDMKQRDIAATINKMKAAKEKQQAAWESKFEDEFVDVTLENVLRGGGDRSILHGSERYRKNFESWLRSCK
jgi:hypothetical protein